MTKTTKFLLRTRVIVPENDRAIVLRNGKFDRILRPGRHWFPSLGEDIVVESYSLSQPEFAGTYAVALFHQRPDLAAAHLTEMRTAASEVAIIKRDGKLYGVQKPDARTVVWTDAGPWEVEKIDVSEELALPDKLAVRLAALPLADRVRRFNVEDGQKGLLYIDNAFQRPLDAGAYAFWNIGRPVAVKIVDMRQQALDVTAQEVLTRDRVSIRVNLSAQYRVVDPIKAVSVVKDFSDALYRALQQAFRRSLGSKTLDEILANKVAVDAEAARSVRDEMREAGVEVGEIAVKDVVLPGDMRDILNRVVLAEKEAEANVIRRREETSATRSLLNTARVMEENPVMLRLKELEALEKIADKVQSLTVHNGTQGLLQDLVTLKAPAAAAKPRR